MNKTIRYEWLEGNQTQIVEPILAERGWTSLNNRTCRVLCAYSGTRLIGFHVLQLFPHAEPLWVARDQRGTGLAETLVDKMMEFLAEVQVRGFMVVADTPATVKLCERHGMKRVDSPVYIL